jgi:peptidoglycan hydrolase-like protein with peptidoglycan-binding domain
LIRRPSQQRGVGAVQDALIALGARISLGAGAASRGIFGPQTQAAVKDFQRSAGIDVDGLVGQDTIGALDVALAQGHQADMQGTGHSEIPGSLDEIIRIAADSVIARHLLVDIFKEGVRCREPDLENFGEGPGRDFQQLSKESPAFAAEFAAITLRNNRQHYGPINRRTVEVLPACDVMFKQVQQAVERSSLCPFLVSVS